MQAAGIPRLFHPVRSAGEGQASLLLFLDSSPRDSRTQESMNGLTWAMGLPLGRGGSPPKYSPTWAQVRGGWSSERQADAMKRKTVREGRPDTAPRAQPVLLSRPHPPAALGLQILPRGEGTRTTMLSRTRPCPYSWETLLTSISKGK